LSASELTEWTAVQRRRETGETGSEPPPTEADTNAPDGDRADDDDLADVPRDA
jgi:hypothetical protein